MFRDLPQPVNILLHTVDFVPCLCAMVPTVPISGRCCEINLCVFCLVAGLCGCWSQIPNSIHNEKTSRLFCLKMFPSVTSAKNKITIFSLEFCLKKTMYYINFSHLCGIYRTLFVLGLMTANYLSLTQP